MSYWPNQWTEGTTDGVSVFFWETIQLSSLLRQSHYRKNQSQNWWTSGQGHHHDRDFHSSIFLSSRICLALGSNFDFNSSSCDFSYPISYESDSFPYPINWHGILRCFNGLLEDKFQAIVDVLAAFSRQTPSLNDRVIGGILRGTAHIRWLLRIQGLMVVTWNVSVVYLTVRTACTWNPVVAS